MGISGMEEIKRKDGGSKKMSSGRAELKFVMSKINLLNLLVWTEIERLTIWFSPLKLPLDDAKFKQWPKLASVISPLLNQSLTDKFWVEYTSLAWGQSPELAVHLPSRFLIFRFNLYDVISHQRNQICLEFLQTTHC